MRPVHDDAPYCPICGARYGLAGPAHRCEPRVLAAIDGAHARGEDAPPPPEYRPLSRRLAEGFRLMGDDA